MLYSYSRLKTLEECPSRFYRKYILDLEEPVGEPAEFGRLVHETLEGIINDGMSVERAMLKAVAASAIKLDIEDAIWQVRRATRYIRPGAAAETHFQLPLYPKDPFSPEVQGYIDYLHPGGLATVLDWKTGRRTFKHDDNHQLGLYAWAVSRMYGVDQVNARLVFLRDGLVSPDDPEVLYGPDEIEAARRWALDLAEQAEKKILALSMGGTPDDLFPAVPGSACRWCSWAAECQGHEVEAVPNGQASIPVPTTIAEAQRLAAEVLRLEATLDAMKDALKEYVQIQGPVVVGDQEWAMRPSVSWNFGPQQKARMAEDMLAGGLNPWEYFTVGSAQLKKLKWPEERLEQYGEKDITHSFRRAKVNKEKEKEDQPTAA